MSENNTNDNNSEQDTAPSAQNGGEVKEESSTAADICCQPQLMYGTYIALPPIFCMVKCAKTQSDHEKLTDDRDDEDEDEFEEEYDNAHQNGKHHGKHKQREMFPSRSREREEHDDNNGKVVDIDKTCPKKKGTFSFPAKNAMYYPKQTLEGTVLELYKKQSYPSNACLMRKCKD